MMFANYIDAFFADFFSDFLALQTPCKGAADSLNKLLAEKFIQRPHGDLARWLSAYERLPDMAEVTSDFTQAAITFNSTHICSADAVALEQGLRGLMPWRKGPFAFFHTQVDCEWRSDFKYQRIRPYLSSLKKRRILDVGCGSGYHIWRMLGDGAEQVVGVDPSMLFLVQFQAAKKYAQAALKQQQAHFLPITLEQLPVAINQFDTVLSMGVLYHRADPIGHLQDLKARLRKGGELLLETLVIDGSLGEVLTPENRYAKMRNVWFIPSVPTLLLWCRRAGFTQAKLVDLSVTTNEEQRRTDWMPYQSLADFLQPDNPQLTLEGYPAPLRASIVAYCD